MSSVDNSYSLLRSSDDWGFAHVYNVTLDSIECRRDSGPQFPGKHSAHWRTLACRCPRCNTSDILDETTSIATSDTINPIPDGSSLPSFDDSPATIVSKCGKGPWVGEVVVLIAAVPHTTLAHTTRLIHHADFNSTDKYFS